MDELGIRLLGPTARSRIDLVWKDAHGDRDGDAFNVEKGQLVFPIETSRRDRGVRQPVGCDDVLDNITAYWLTNTAISSARLYWENKLAFFDVKGVTIPVAVSVFPDEIYAAPRSWTERAYPKLIHYNKLDRGGHFAAWEQPQLFVQELRTGLRSLRK